MKNIKKIFGISLCYIFVNLTYGAPYNFSYVKVVNTTSRVIKINPIPGYQELDLWGTGNIDPHSTVSLEAAGFPGSFLAANELSIDGVVAADIGISYSFDWNHGIFKNIDTYNHVFDYGWTSGVDYSVTPSEASYDSSSEGTIYLTYTIKPKMFTNTTDIAQYADINGTCTDKWNLGDVENIYGSFAEGNWKVPNVKNIQMTYDSYDRDVIVRNLTLHNVPTMSVGSTTKIFLFSTYSVDPLVYTLSCKSPLLTPPDDPQGGAHDVVTAISSTNSNLYIGTFLGNLYKVSLPLSTPLNYVLLGTLPSMIAKIQQLPNSKEITGDHFVVMSQNGAAIDSVQVYENNQLSDLNINGIPFTNISSYLDGFVGVTVPSAAKKASVFRFQTNGELSK